MSKKVLKRFAQIIIIMSFILGTLVLLWILNKTRPIAEVKVVEETRTVVEVAPVKLKTVTMELVSNGTVQAKKRTQLAAELAGKVVFISEKFMTGGKFEEGEVILKLDTSTYETVLAQAQAQLVEAEVVLTSEKARADQARRDWDRLGRGKASTLTLREPQIKNAESRVAAAKAALEKARRDLERTSIKAPFNATVSRKATEIGNFVAPGAPIGEFFQTSPLEIRIPLPLDDARFLKRKPEGGYGGEMTLSTNLGNQMVEWKATIDRDESQVDLQSRSIYLISDILPNQKTDSPITLQPGLFLDATISGKVYEKIAVVPASAFYDLAGVRLVTPQGRLELRQVEVLHRTGNLVYVSSGLAENERLCITEVPTNIEGTEVEVRELPAHPQARIENNLR
jgi:RND family efflux transporter MFP subunit